MKSRLTEGPMTIALQAGNDCFMYYESGVLTMATMKSLGCGSSVDHAVVLAGIHYAGDEGNAADTDNNDGDNDGDNDGGNDDDDDDTEYEEVCRRAKKFERK